jgi:hypothetical protein
VTARHLQRLSAVRLLISTSAEQQRMPQQQSLHYATQRKFKLFRNIRHAQLPSTRYTVQRRETCVRPQAALQQCAVCVSLDNLNGSVNASNGDNAATLTSTMGVSTNHGDLAAAITDSTTPIQLYECR